MIRIIVKYGSGDRKAAVVSDPLLRNVACATMRAKQELAEFTYFKFKKTLDMPHDPNAGVGGDYTREFAFQPLGIFGTHIIISRTINLSPTSAKDSVDIEQYKEMFL